MSTIQEQLQRVKQQMNQQAVEKQTKSARPPMAVNATTRGANVSPWRVSPKHLESAQRPVEAAEPARQEEPAKNGTGKRSMSSGNRKKILKLVAHWPALFSLDECKPVKVGVADDLLADARARGLDTTEGQIRFGLCSHTHRVLYLKALVAGGHRFDMNGQPCGEVTSEQQQNAADKLAEMKMRTQTVTP